MKENLLVDCSHFGTTTIDDGSETISDMLVHSALKFGYSPNGIDYNLEHSCFYIKDSLKEFGFCHNKSLSAYRCKKVSLRTMFKKLSFKQNNHPLTKIFM